MSEKVEKVKLSEKLGFAAFSCSSNIIYNFKSLYYLIFLTNVLKIDVLMAGVMLTIGNIWDAINDPLIGIWSTNHKFKNGEKVRPYALYCCVPWAITIVLLFCDFKTSQTVTVILGLVIYFLYEGLNTFLGMPYNSMGALATNDDGDRKSINAFRSLGGCFGTGIGAVAVTPIVKLFGGLQGENAIISSADARALFLTACTMGIISVIGSLAHYFTTKERVKQESDNEDEISLKEGYKMLFKCKSWVYNMLYIICYGVLNTLVMSMINYYAAYILGSSAAATPILAVYLVISIIASFITPDIDKKLGRKKTMIVSAIILIIGKIPFIIAPRSMVTIYINAISVALGMTMAFIMFNTNRNNISDIIEWDNDRRIDSFVSSGDNLVSKLATAVASQLITLALSWSGFNADLGIAQPAATTNIICSLLGLVPCIITFIMLFILFKMDVQKEYAETKAAYLAKKN